MLIGDLRQRIEQERDFAHKIDGSRFPREKAAHIQAAATLEAASAIIECLYTLGDQLLHNLRDRA